MNTKFKIILEETIDELIEKLLELEKESIQLDTGSYFKGKYSHFTSEFHEVKTRSLNILEQLEKRLFIEKVAKFVAADDHIIELRGILSGLKKDIISGLISNFALLIESNVTGDYLTQAESLLLEGKTGNYDHIPAAVLTGAILEDSLRRLCQRQEPPIEIKKSNGTFLTLDPLIDNLKSTGFFNELKAKQLRAWAGIRNAAVHGRFDDFTRKDTEEMLTGVKNFLADYM